MIIRLQTADLAHVLDFNFKKFEEAGRCRLSSDSRKRSLALYQSLYREGKCLHLAFQVDNRKVALAGALLSEETAFLSLQTVRHGLIIDEYVFPEYRNQGIAPKLRQELLAWLAEKGARLSPVLPPNSARLACTLGNLRL